MVFTAKIPALLHDEGQIFDCGPLLSYRRLLYFTGEALMVANQTLDTDCKWQIFPKMKMRTKIICVPLGGNKSIISCDA